MKQFFSRLSTACLVFGVSLFIATVNLCSVLAMFAWALLSLPVESWERAKAIEQELLNQEG